MQLKATLGRRLGFAMRIRLGWIPIVAACILLTTSSCSSPPPGALIRQDLLEQRVSLLVPAVLEKTDEPPAVTHRLLNGSHAITFKSPDNGVRLEIVQGANDDAATQHRFQAPPRQLLSLIQQSVTSLDPTADWFKNEVVDIDGHPRLRIDYRTKSSSMSERVLLVLASTPDGPVMVGMTFSKSLESDWLGIAKVVVDSLEVEGE